MRYLLLLYTFLLTTQVAFAQRKEDRNKFPKAVLVLLSSEHNRIESLEKARAYKEAEQLKKDATMVSEKIRLDFKDNFHMYPVYFFVDTNLEKVKAGKLADILTNTDGDLMEITELGDSSTDFFIIYYGYPKFTKKKPKRIKEGSEDAASFDTPTGKYFVICNNKLEQITYVRRGKNTLIDEVSPEDKKYRYNSPTFNISYSPTVRKLPGVLTGLSLNYP